MGKAHIGDLLARKQVVLENRVARSFTGKNKRRGLGKKATPYQPCKPRA
jgi:hypothetical protein